MDNKIEAIEVFLNNWKQKAFDFYVNEAKEYDKLKAREEEASQEWYALQTERIKQAIGMSWKLYFKKSYYETISDTIKICCRTGKLNENQLKDMIEKESEAKRKMLIKRISDKCGEIQDARYLTIGLNGEINGIVEGSKAKAKVETITAGGWNIQCLHFRVLVNTL